jgi:hypothetical protein
MQPAIRALVVGSSFSVLDTRMGAASTLARAVDVDRRPAPLSLVRPAAWALVVACGLAAIHGAVAIHTTEEAFAWRALGLAL